MIGLFFEIIQIIFASFLHGLRTDFVIRVKCIHLTGQFMSSAGMHHFACCFLQHPGKKISGSFHMNVMFTAVCAPFFQQFIAYRTFFTAVDIAVNKTPDNDHIPHSGAVHVIQKPFHFTAVIMGNTGKICTDHKRIFFGRQFPDLCNFCR